MIYFAISHVYISCITIQDYFVSKKFVPVCKFDNIKSTKPLPELENKHMELIPKDEVEPCIRNTQWR